jgi:ribosomal protein S18 acetylase RimI-like enzyme
MKESGLEPGSFAARESGDGTIFALFIDRAHEGRGIGRALLRPAVDALRARWSVDADDRIGNACGAVLSDATAGPRPAVRTTDRSSSRRWL